MAPRKMAEERTAYISVSNDCDAEINDFINLHKNESESIKIIETTKSQDYSEKNNTKKVKNLLLQEDS